MSCSHPNASLSYLYFPHSDPLGLAAQSQQLRKRISFGVAYAPSDVKVEITKEKADAVVKKFTDAGAVAEAIPVPVSLR